MGLISFLALIFMLLIIPLVNPAFADETSLETYIVQLDGIDAQLFTQSDNHLDTWYHSFLPQTTASENGGSSRMIHSYRNVFKGFAARLSADEVSAMENKDGFVSAHPEKILSLHTTHSPKFLGLVQNMGFWKDSNYGKGVIIGVLDTGILPEHPSFSDDQMPPPPATWKGKCEFKNRTCNNKIIGARSFVTEDQSPYDQYGHGTHTASTAAGNFVKGANVFGNANGTAAGIAPLAHLAIYKVCFFSSCTESDVLAGMDAAIEDGVDVLSISLGRYEDNFYQDFNALGAFSAMDKGILVSASAGNGGPSNSSLLNQSPWILTVGASTIDRKIMATALLGNKEQYHGESLYQQKGFPDTLLPLVYAGSLNGSDPLAPYCSQDSLNGTDLHGKVVVCESGLVLTTEKGEAVKNAGGAAMILLNSEYYANTIQAQVHALPATRVSYADGLKIKSYINSTTKPMATILFQGTIIGDHLAPVVAAFSSRGPNSVSPGIFKPDILGPGVNILAAWPTSIENRTDTKSTFNILTGTSMSCPHLAGVAALLKSAHPDWSPAAIKSAIMTTADTINLAHDPILDERFLPANIFATGAGHVDPSKANDAGLVYDIQPKDYIPYLCGLNYTNREVGFFLQRRVDCAVESSITDGQLNYPAFAITFTSQSTSQTYTRTVTNVGQPVSSYRAEIKPPPGVDVRVDPTTLEFSELNQKMHYEITFRRLNSARNDTVVQGFLKWTTVEHSVRSPIAVTLQ